MRISDETMKTVMELAKLTVPEEEKKVVRQDLENILGFMERLKEPDTEGVEPMPHVLPLENVFREDAVGGGQSREELLENAPVKKEGCFVVPRTVE